jgi:hypothetical protein
MEEFNYLQFLNDDNDILEAEELLVGNFPSFAVTFNQTFADFASNIAEVPHAPESTETKTNEIQTATSNYKSRSKP